MKGKMKKTFLKITSSIPVSLLLVAVAMVGVGVGFHDWRLAGAVAGIALWPMAPALVAGPFCDTPGFIGQYKVIAMNGEFTAETFSAAISQLRDQINGMLAGLPPLEQYEAASELSYGMRALRNSAANLVTLAGSLEESVKQYATKLTTQAEQTAEAKLLEKGEFVKKTDAQTATNTAVEAKEKEVRAAVENDKKEVARVTAARAKLVTDKICSEPVANALSVEFFKQDGYGDRVAKLTARMKKLADNKLTADEFVQEMAALPMDDAGDQTFESRVKSVQSLVSQSATRGGGNLNAGLIGDPDTKEVLIF